MEHLSSIQLLWDDGLFVVVGVLRISQRTYTINIVMHRPEPSIISNMQAVHHTYIHMLCIHSSDRTQITVASCAGAYLRARAKLIYYTYTLETNFPNQVTL